MNSYTVRIIELFISLPFTAAHVFEKQMVGITRIDLSLSKVALQTSK